MLAKRFALKMAATMRGLFGAGAMYGTVATITRVAFSDNDITDSAVREWCAQEAASPGSRDNEKLIELIAVWLIHRGNNLSKFSKLAEMIRTRTSGEIIQF
jgi:hypothetical protein